MTVKIVKGKERKVLYGLVVVSPPVIKPNCYHILLRTHTWLALSTEKVDDRVSHPSLGGTFSPTLQCVKDWTRALQRFVGDFLILRILLVLAIVHLSAVASSAPALVGNS